MGFGKETVDRAREDCYDREAKRCLTDCTNFRQERVAGATLRRRAEFPQELLREAIRRHDAKIDAGDGEGVLKVDHRTRVTVGDTADPRWPRLCVKEFHRALPRQRLVDLLHGPPARRAWLGAHACRVRSISTPEPFGVLECGARSYFVNEYVQDAVPVRDRVADFAGPRDRQAKQRWRSFLEDLAAWVAQFHAHRLRHRDLAAKNVLTREREGRWEFYLIDLSDIRLGRAPSRRLKIWNLAQLAQMPLPPSRADKLRFFRRYVVGHPELDRPQTLREIETLVRTRDDRSLARTGRHRPEQPRRERKAS